MELCRRRPGSRQEGIVEETAVNTPLTVTGTITDIHTKTGQTMTGKAGVKDVPADHLTEKDATLTDEKEIMQTAEKDPEAKETAKAVPLKEEALPEPPAETEPPAEIMLRMTEEAADTVRAAPGNGGMPELSFQRTSTTTQACNIPSQEVIFSDVFLMLCQIGGDVFIFLSFYNYNLFNSSIFLSTFSNFCFPKL